jgi:HlyD family secretion protein
MMKKKWAIFVTATLLLVVSYLGLRRWDSSDGGKRTGVNKIALVEVQKVKTRTMSETVNLTGEVVATNAVTLSATVDGIISFCPWREGDKVKKDETLIKIDRPIFIAEMEASKAALQVAKAKLDDLKSGTRPEEIQRARESMKSLEENLVYTTKDLKRNETLRSKSAISEESLELSRVAHAKSTSDLAAAREQLKMLIAGPTQTKIAIMEAQEKEAFTLLKVAEAKVAECELRASFDGTVTKAFVRKGDLARAKEPLLGLMEPASIVVRFAVPEQYARSLSKGGAVQVLVDACCERYINSVVIRIFPQVDENTHTFLVEAKLPDGCRSVPGMFARVRLPVKTVKNAPVVLESAVLTSPSGRQIAFVVADGKAVRRNIRVGLESGGFIQILDGISVDENVVVAGNEALKNGMPVKVRTGTLPSKKTEKSRERYGK